MSQAWTKSRIINRLAELRSYRSYLEVCTPVAGGQFADIDRARFDTCHRLVYCCPATFDDGLRVDFRSPDRDIGGCLRQLKASSRYYDVIFVDALHDYDTTIRDLRAMFERLTPSGLMVVHDCLPPRAELAAPAFKAGAWNGLVYKAFIDFVNERTDLFYCTIDSDFGCGLIRKKTGREFLQHEARRLLSFITGARGPQGQDVAACDVMRRWRTLGNDFQATYDFMQQHKRQLMGVVRPADFTGAALGWAATVRLDDTAAEMGVGPTVTAEPPVQDASNLSIAAVIPLHNGARYIELALRSVLDQTVQADEIIVVDDGSTDAGADIVEALALKHPIKLIRKANGGQSSARNVGVAHATSALIALLDQDDFWYANHLERLVEPFCSKQTVPIGWVYSDVDEIDIKGAMINRKFLRTMANEHPKVSLNACLAGDMFVLPSASLISRVAFERAGGFDERLSGYEDDDLFLKLFSLGFTNAFIEEPLSQWVSTIPRHPIPGAWRNLG